MTPKSPFSHLSRIRRIMSADQQSMPAPATTETESLNAHDTEKVEEEKLKAKYPSAAQGLRAPGGHSAFLQKRLQKGVSAEESMVTIA